jgi:hydrogenase/urease accessory protein HupE
LRDVTVETGLLEAQIRQTRIQFSAAPLDSNKEIILGWAAELGPLIVRQISSTKSSDDSTTSASALYAAYLAPGERSDAVQLAGATELSLPDIVRRYAHSGFVHIIPLGLDHILFVLGLFLFSLSGRVLFYQISLFTLAHTLTLALSSLGIVRIAGQIVEPLIALSIAYVAIETIWAKSRFSLQRALLIIGFGLLHGLGFASVLADFGLPNAQFIPALISFNIGVEAGQIALVFPLYLLVRWWRPPARFYRFSIQIPVSVLIASIGLYWTLERVGWLPV